MTDEEARAAAYRAMRVAQTAQRRARAAALAGDPTARATQVANWAPLQQWWRERQPPAPPESEP